MRIPRPLALTSLVLLGLAQAATFGPETPQDDTGVFSEAASRSSNAARLATKSNILIVEFDKAAPETLKRDGFLSQHAKFHHHMKRATSPATGKPLSYRTRYTFDNDLFMGASLLMAHPVDEKVVRNIPGVKSVSQAAIYSAPTFKGASMASNMKAMANASDTFGPHRMTGVDKLHAEKILGQGVTIGVIDSGVDASHPALQGALKGGYDLVGDDYDAGKTPQPDENPYIDSSCHGASHGTFTTGIIAARDVGQGFSGVAPEASIKMYRVFGCGDNKGVTSDVTMAAAIRAYQDNVDAMVMSFGGQGGWRDPPDVQLYDRIAQKGVPIFVASGFSGNVGAFYSYNPASGKYVTAVGAVNNVELLGYSVEATETPPVQPSREIFLAIAAPFVTQKNLPVKVLNTDPAKGENDACNADDVAKAGDLSNSVVVVGRGSCGLRQKV